MRLLRTCVVLLCLVLVGAVAPATFAHAVGAQKGTYYPLTSSRVLDTRAGSGTPLGPNATLQLTVSGRGGVPTSGVAAVVINLTVTGPTASSYLTAYPSGLTRPTVSSINFVKGVTRANSATVPLGSGGKIAIYNNAGSVSVIADVVGFYASNDTPKQTLGEGNEFYPLDPDRLIDTRHDPDGALKGENILTLDVKFGSGGASSPSVRALALNITAVGATGPGYLTTWNGAGKPPSTSTLNFSGASATANLAIVKTGFCAACASPKPVEFAVYNGSKLPVHVIVDLVGVYYNDGTYGLRFTPLTPRRISDSRSGLNGSPLTVNQTQQLTGPSSVVGADTVALVTNVTAIQPTAATYLTLWEAGTDRPAVSNLNASANTTVANGAVFAMSSANKFGLYNNAGTGNFVIDVTGRFDIGGAASAMAPAATTKAPTSADQGASEPSTTQQRRSTASR